MRVEEAAEDVPRIEERWVPEPAGTGTIPSWRAYPDRPERAQRADEREASREGDQDENTRRPCVRGVRDAATIPQDDLR